MESENNEECQPRSEKTLKSRPDMCKVVAMPVLL